MLGALPETDGVLRQGVLLQASGGQVSHALFARSVAGDGFHRVQAELGGALLEPGAAAGGGSVEHDQ